ncbi:hypothetical protein FIBSPDRAFT_852241 [Athelia psychrophila]|uniref:BHLH domain-containing protein n=1 Tax=Athelia psychrophila TaxID=1759441 RepID=A0A166S3W2_9AGAM|nr:hypothetical protein FIBSPDRAFT_852241 [Fibularhizoctonia sp. CBS 109695]
MSHSPVPFSDFEFTFDPAISEFFPPPPPPPHIALPSSADLFSQSETTDILGFLDNFNWEFDADPMLSGYELPEHEMPPPSPLRALPPYTNPHTNESPEPSASGASRVTRSNSSRKPKAASSKPRTNTSRPRDASVDTLIAAADTPGAQSRAKPLLSTPQKRLNHIMSEQKRRNAIRDGYAQLIALLAPAGAPGLGMPTRGRPKGSGSRGKGAQTKGKSGVLFRAVEYVKWLEEGRDALLQEVLRTEGAAGIRR